MGGVIHIILMADDVDEHSIFKPVDEHSTFHVNISLAGKFGGLSYLAEDGEKNIAMVLLRIFSF